MKISFIILLMICGSVQASSESYFFRLDGVAEEALIQIENGMLVTKRPIRKVDYKITSIDAYFQGLGKGRAYQIEIHGLGIAPKVSPPLLKLDSAVLTNLKFLYSEGRQAMTIESDDPKLIRKYVAALRALSGLPDSKININLKRTEPQVGSSAGG